MTLTKNQEIAIGCVSIVAVVLLLWVGIASASYHKDAAARQYAQTNSVEATPVATGTTTGGQTTVVVQSQQQPSFWPYFFYGYMLGGWGNYGGYGGYMQTTNNNYYTSPTYQTQVAAQAAIESSWGSDINSSAGSWGSNSADTGSSWGSDSSSGSSWSSDNGGSWGSDSSWGSTDSGSWGSDSGSSWGSSGSSGSWGND